MTNKLSSVLTKLILSSLFGVKPQRAQSLLLSLFDLQSLSTKNKTRLRRWLELWMNCFSSSSINNTFESFLVLGRIWGRLPFYGRLHYFLKGKRKDLMRRHISPESRKNSSLWSNVEKVEGVWFQMCGDLILTSSLCLLFDFGFSWIQEPHPTRVGASEKNKSRRNTTRLHPLKR